MNTLPDAERFRLHVDSLEAALLHFDDLPACLAHLKAQEGPEYAERAVRALAERLNEQAGAA